MHTLTCTYPTVNPANNRFQGPFSQLSTAHFPLLAFKNALLELKSEWPDTSPLHVSHPIAPIAQIFSNFPI